MAKKKRITLTQKCDILLSEQDKIKLHFQTLNNAVRDLVLIIDDLSIKAGYEGADDALDKIIRRRYPEKEMDELQSAPPEGFESPGVNGK